MGFFGSGGDADGIVRDDDGIVIIDFPVLAASFIPAADGEAKGQSVGIAGDERFREDDEFGPVLAGFHDLAHDFIDSRFLVE